MPTLTPAEIAEDLRVSYGTVVLWIRGGLIPGFKAGHFWRVDVEDYAAWKAEAKQRAAKDLEAAPGKWRTEALRNAMEAPAHQDPMGLTPRSAAYFLKHYRGPRS